MGTPIISNEQLGLLSNELGLSLASTQAQQLEEYAGFVVSEGIIAGGVGPHERERIYDRHIADSLVFLGCLPSGHVSVADIGSGIGLPGIPIAIARPETEITLVDRAQRRCDLARRGARIAGATNVRVVQADVASIKATFDCVVFRASLPLREALVLGPRLLNPGGIMIFGVSRKPERPNLDEDLKHVPSGWSAELVEMGAKVLDSPAWLLRMSPA